MTKNHFEQHTVAKVILVQKFDIKFKVLTIFLKSVTKKLSNEFFGLELMFCLSVHTKQLTVLLATSVNWIASRHCVAQSFLQETIDCVGRRLTHGKDYQRRHNQEYHYTKQKHW